MLASERGPWGGFLRKSSLQERRAAEAVKRVIIFLSFMKFVV
jgi:hypothetical protein